MEMNENYTEKILNILKTHLNMILRY